MNMYPPGGGLSNDPVVQALQLALSGFGYNFYNTQNQARSDDLLVRGKASGYLSDAVTCLMTLAGEYQVRHIPPLTRENPDPPREALAAVQGIRDLQQEIADLEGRVRGMAVPTADRIWGRFRQELMTLRQLLQFDLDLVRGAEVIYQQASNANADSWTSAYAQEVRAMVRRLNQIAQAREQFLRVPL
ncbi:MAG TPA: hypothetical protein VH599_01930 [Ktedonobacterales bacterium]|jgi:hypothetical protein